MFMNLFSQWILPCPSYGTTLCYHDHYMPLLTPYLQRTFLRVETTNKALQIQAIGLSLYEPVDGTTAEVLGQDVVRTQWL